MPDINVSQSITVSEPLRTISILAAFVMQIGIWNEVVEIGEYPVIEPPATTEFGILGVADLDRIYLVECKVGREIENDSWVATGGGAYYISFSSFTYGEVVSVTEDATTYTQVASVSACNSVAGSFYYDFTNQRLYVHTVSGESPDAPAESGNAKFCIIAYFWICFTNTQNEDDRIIFTPKNAANPVYFLPYLNSDNMPSVTQSVGTFQTGDLKIQFGTLTFINDGWFYWAFEQLLWHNAKVYIKVGELGDTYEEFFSVFVGVIRNPSVKDEEASFDIEDGRSSELAEIPLTAYDSVNRFEWIEGSPDDGHPIGIPFGFCQGVVPVCYDPAEYLFKVSDYPIKGITAVYENGIELYPPGSVDLVTGEPNAEYFVWPEKGEFGLLQDFEDHVITCDVEGIKCSRGGIYSDNFSDGCLFVLEQLNRIPPEEIDYYAFEQLRAARTQKMGYYVDSTTPSLEILRLFQSSIVCQLFPDSNGKWTVKRYTSGSTDALTITKEEIRELGIKYDTDGTFWQVNVKYKRDPSTNESLIASASDPKTKYRYKESKTLEIESALYDGNEAKVLALFFLNMVKVPPKTVTLDIGIDAFGRDPTEKVSISKSIIDGDGNTVAILTNEVYRVLEFRKDLGPATTGISGTDDSLSSGVFHVDVNHVDSHSDSYVDTAHADVAHVDVDPHVDAPHTDTPHADVHDDLYNDYGPGYAHNDHSDGVMHNDGGNWSYDDGGAHSDYSDVNTATGIHIDRSYIPNGSHYYIYHVDYHENVAYADSPDNTPDDVAHQDTPYYDVHDQQHGDVPHGDASY